MSLLGAEWVLYLLIGLSILSIALIIERVLFYRTASRGLSDFREQVRKVAGTRDWESALKLAQARANQTRDRKGISDLETAIACALLTQPQAPASSLSELARDALMRAKLPWDRNLSILATIGSNAPFIGLFGTVLGIIKAFHDLSQQSSAGTQTVTAGISEALVATAVGLLVAIPAVVAFNLFQRKVKAALSEAEALKSYLIGKMGG